MATNDLVSYGTTATNGFVDIGTIESGISMSMTYEDSGKAHAIIILDKAINDINTSGYGFTVWLWRSLIANAIEYLKYGNVHSHSAIPEAFFANPDPPKPAIQLGMLGRKDGELIPSEMYSEDELEPCISGAHKYVKGYESHCECKEANCGCIIDPDVISICSNCEQCQSCCEASEKCAYCDRCDETVDSDSICSNCDYCKSCCATKGKCWTCDSCEKTYSINDTDSCANCDYCESCCECQYCESCSEKHDSSTKWCQDCNNCKEGCDCVKECQQCGTKESFNVILCKVCRYCGECGCKCPPPPPPPWQANTQKVKGFLALGGLGAYSRPSANVYKASTVNPYYLVNKFVRPCPTIPRHGFVDSRFISTEKEAAVIIKESLAADADAEFLAMQKIECKYSGIWTPGLIAIGPDNDGATTGRKAITVNVAGDFLQGATHVLTQAGIKNAPYIELLWPKVIAGQFDRAQLVQLRDGPKLPQEVDYINKATTVSKVILADGDLLAWEELMLNQPKGTVVYHPGGTLASHYAVHAVLNNTPVLISHEPKIGDVLLPSKAATNKSKPNMEQIRLGFYWAMTTKNVRYRSACYMMLLGCHSTVGWIGKHDLLLGVALGFCYRLSIIAAIGEWRHRPRKNKDEKLSREAVYGNIWSKVHKVRRLYMRVLKDFRRLPWPDGLGGENWFQFTRWATTIFNAMIDGDFTIALEAMNKAINASHNNGWGFNKFASGSAMDFVAANPVVAIEYCGPILYEAMTGITPELVQDSNSWFKKVRKYDTSCYNKWLNIAITPEQANYAQAKLINDNELLIQLKPNYKNSKAYGTVTIPLADSTRKKIKDTLMHKLYTEYDNVKDDGRIVASCNPADKTSKFLQLHKYVELGTTWSAYDPISGRYIALIPMLGTEQAIKLAAEFEEMKKSEIKVKKATKAELLAQFKDSHVEILAKFKETHKVKKAATNV